MLNICTYIQINNFIHISLALLLSFDIIFMLEAKPLVCILTLYQLQRFYLYLIKYMFVFIKLSSEVYLNVLFESYNKLIYTYVYKKITNSNRSTFKCKKLEKDFKSNPRNKFSYLIIFVIII